MLGRLHHVVLDCADPGALASFYSRLLGHPITYQSEDWVVVATSDTSSGLAFQFAPGHRSPTWPDPAVPQQVHLIKRPSWAPPIPATPASSQAGKSAPPERMSVVPGQPRP